jgi:REP element-mobilizing transposase RayT
MTNIIIKTQNRKQVFNYNNIAALGIEECYYKGELKEWRIAAKLVGANHIFTLGSYPSEYVCADALNRITDEIINGVEYIEVPER